MSREDGISQTPQAFDFCNRARILLELRRPAEALRELSLVDGDIAWGWQLRAFALGRLRRFDEARSAARRSIELAPEDPDSYAELARADLTAGNAQAALETIEKAVSLAPESARLLAMHALIMMENRRFAEAREICARAESIDPDHPEVQLVVAAAATGGRFPDAPEQTEALLSKMPDSSEAHFLTALSLLHQSRFDPAMEHLRRSIAINPANAQALALMRKMTAWWLAPLRAAASGSRLKRNAFAYALVAVVYAFVGLLLWKLSLDEIMAWIFVAMMSASLIGVYTLVRPAVVSRWKRRRRST